MRCEKCCLLYIFEIFFNLCFIHTSILVSEHFTWIRKSLVFFLLDSKKLEACPRPIDCNLIFWFDSHFHELNLARIGFMIVWLMTPSSVVFYSCLLDVWVEYKGESFSWTLPVWEGFVASQVKGGHAVSPFNGLMLIAYWYSWWPLFLRSIAIQPVLSPADGWAGSRFCYLVSA